MKKIYFRVSNNKIEELKDKILKSMVLNICENVEIEELYPAKTFEGEEGIYIRTGNEGKMFWNSDELGKIYAKKNHEEKRFRF